MGNGSDYAAHVTKGSSSSVVVVDGGGVALGQRRGGGGQRGNQFCQPSEAVVVRELACGNSISKKVDLNRALENPQERILIQPNDVVLVRYTLCEEVGNVLLNAFQINYLLGAGR